MVTIPTIDQISGTTVMNKMRSLITNYIDFGTQVAGELSYMMNVIENLPQDITDVYNKATIDAMFANVYQKSETYSKTEVNDLISTIGSFHAVIVDSLPQYGDEGVIYLVKISESGENRYKEYIWVNRWELIGELSNVDLTNYYTKSESDAKFTQGVGNIGTDIKPVKILNGVATPISNNLQKEMLYTQNPSTIEILVNTITVTQKYNIAYGKIIILNFEFKSSVDISPHTAIFNISPHPQSTLYMAFINLSGGNNGAGFVYTDGGVNTPITIRANNYYAVSIIYIIN